MMSAARIGRRTANGPAAQAKRAIKASKNALVQHSWKASDQPAWLTQELFEQTNSAPARKRFHVRHSIFHRSFKVVCEQDPQRLSSASAKMVSARGAGWRFKSFLANSRSLDSGASTDLNLTLVRWAGDQENSAT
jgi:hypothetical protein